MAVLTLPVYPSAKTRATLSPSQQATLHSRISGALSEALMLPASKRDVPSMRTFISSYAKDHAQVILESLIWDPEHASKSLFAKMSPAEKTVHQRVLSLSEKLATELDLQTVIDLCVVYGRSNTKRVRELLSNIAKDNQVFLGLLDSEAVPAFTTLFNSSSQGLYGLRKIAHVLLSVLKPAPAEIIRPFARSKHLVLALATAYDTHLLALARSYGGIPAARLQAPTPAPADDWERVFLETKVALLDTLHVLLRTLLSDVEAERTAGPALAARCDAAFEVVFALLEHPPARPPSDSDAAPTPFLDCTLLEDYQHAYDLSSILRGAAQRADDPRTALLEAALDALETSDAAEPGALRLLVRSSGAPPGIDARGRGPVRPPTDAPGKGKGKGRAPPPPPPDPALDAAVAQVLDILPEQSPEYVRYVLAHPDYPFKGDAERLVGALLEGTAPQVEESVYMGGGEVGVRDDVREEKVEEQFVYTKERRNVFDEERLDLSKLRVGKKQEDSATMLQDRAFIEQMKADILRRAEAMSDDEEEEDDTVGGAKGKGADVAFEDELDEEGAVKVRDGQPSEDEGEQETDDEDGAVGTPAKPETILELAYIRDPKLFDRDAQTRRGKPRQDLKGQTGWSDEQIEGWRIMLERNPNKDKILQKHEFSGNQRGPLVLEAGPSQRGRGGRGGGGPRGRGGGRGRGRGGGPGHGQDGEGSRGDGGSARDRAWKDKNKASRGNHNRKRGHDKKMARAGGPS